MQHHRLCLQFLLAFNDHFQFHYAFLMHSFFSGCRISWLKLQARLRHNTLLRQSNLTTLMEVVTATHLPLQILLLVTVGNLAAMAQFTATAMVIKCCSSRLLPTLTLSCCMLYTCIASASASDVDPFFTWKSWTNSKSSFIFNLMTLKNCFPNCVQSNSFLAFLENLE